MSGGSQDSAPSPRPSVASVSSSARQLTLDMQIRQQRVELAEAREAVVAERLSHLEAQAEMHASLSSRGSGRSLASRLSGRTAQSGRALTGGNDNVGDVAVPESISSIHSHVSAAEPADARAHARRPPSSLPTDE